METVHRKTYTKGLFCLLFVVAMILAAFGAVAEETGKVVGGVLYLWEEPSLTSTIIATYPTDTTVDIVSEEDDFYYVTMPDGKTGYIAIETVQVYVDGETSAEVGQVVGGELHLRAEPSLDSIIIASYPTGTEMTILGEEDGFYHVRMSDGNEGYMEATYVQVLAYDGTGVVYEAGKVIGGNLHLRAEPSLESEIMATYETGTVVQITGEAGDFYHVITPDDKIGYMEKEYLYVY